MTADVQNAVICRIFSVFWSGFCRKQLEVICRTDFNMFLEFSFFSQSEDFAWAIAFACMMAHFQNALISGIFCVFWSGFLQRTTRNDV